MCNFIIITVPADGQAPLGAGTSAGAVMTNFVYIGPALEGQIMWHVYGLFHCVTWLRVSGVWRIAFVTEM